MWKLLYTAIVPIFILLIFVYIKDKYEKEPLRLATTGTFYGMLISMPITFTENFLSKFTPTGNIPYSFYTAFIVASLVEETYKYIILKFLIYKNKNYNEPFDGILYAVFISLGFASVENILYVFNPSIGGIKTAFLRAIFSVPAHMSFGVYMGYYLSKKKFSMNKINMFIALLMPFIIHGIYDFLLFAKFKYVHILFIIFYLYMICVSLKRINYYIRISPFKWFYDINGNISDKN